jgi:hypothetical protein
MPTKKTNPAESFFFEHGGYSYDPKKETKAQGKRRSARDAAKAEKIARELGWRFEWQEDPEPYEMGDAETEMPFEVLMVTMYDENGEAVQSLGSIGMSGKAIADRQYARVVESDLALEHAHTRGLI